MEFAKLQITLFFNGSTYNVMQTVVIGSNDEDGIAVFIEENLLGRCD